MREIKFRGLTKEGNWVKGDKVEIGKRCWIVSKPEIVESDDYDVWIEEIRCSIWGFIEVIPETVRQYTGLKDKNGKKDWVDDIVKVKVGPHVHYRKIYQAESGAFCIKLPALGQTSLEGEGIMLCTIEHKNVGNVHENPELLEE